MLGSQQVKADFIFGPPENLGPVINSSLHDAGAAVSPDGLTLAFMRHVTWNVNPEFLMSTRVTKDAHWEVPENYGVWNESLWDLVGVWPGLTTADGLELYFNEDLPGGYGSSDLWVKKRDTTEANWGPPVNLGPVVNSPYDEIWPVLSPDELELFFSGFSSTNARPGGQGGADVWVTRRVSRNDPWGEPVNLGPTINSPDNDARPSLSADGLVLFFDSQQPGGAGSADLYMAKRSTPTDPWEVPVNLGSFVNSPVFEECAQLSADGSTLYWDSDRAGGYGGHDIWQAPLLPIVDFNGDGIVDASDMCVVLDHWGEDYSLCDVGPMPWGDGTVDMQDLAMLSEYLFKALDDPTLLAHWTLDETEGSIAHDSANGNDGALRGDPAWQPEGGVLNGALQLDGIDDFIGAPPSIMNPADGSFSVFAWIRGGAPGQVVLSQANNKNWLCIDLEGNLMTELTSFGRSGTPLQCETIITDGQWHRVGFVWDGSSRMLYVDDVRVAEDTQNHLTDANNGLHIGTGSGREPGTFWSGLIDDVRIYNRAVKP
jgi:hypothetical protein